MKRRTWIALLITCAAVVAYGLVVRRTPEERVRRQIAALVDASGIDPAERDPRARPLRIQRAFRRLLTAVVRVEIPSLVEDAHARDELAGMMVSAAQTFRALDIAVGDVRVAVDDGGHTARATGTATITGTDHDGQEVRAVRAIGMRFEEASGEWRISSVTAESPANAEEGVDLVSAREGGR